MIKLNIVYCGCIILLNVDALISPSLQYPGNNKKLAAIIEASWEKYYKCIKDNYKISSNRMTYIYIFPGQYGSLECTHCVKPFEDDLALSWTYTPLIPNGMKVTYEDLTNDFTLGKSNELQIIFARPTFTGLYQCHRGKDVLSDYIVEIPANPNILQVDKVDSALKPLFELKTGIVTSTVVWQEWTECSSCDSVGKRFTYATCWLMFNGSTSEEYPDSTQPPAQVPEDAQLEIQKLLSIFPNGISCTSRFLSVSTAFSIEMLKASHLVAVNYCQESCADETDDSIDLLKKFNSKEKDNVKAAMESKMLQFEKERIKVANNSFLILQCPGRSIKHIPITWKVKGKEIIADILNVQSKGRFVIDAFNRIVIGNCVSSDSNFYSCWQRSNLLGVIHLEVEHEEDHATNMDIVIYISMVLLISLVALKISKQATQHRI